MNWLIFMAFAIGGLIVAGAEYFLIFADAPRLLRISVSGIVGAIFLICGFLAASR